MQDCGTRLPNRFVYVRGGNAGALLASCVVRTLSFGNGQLVLSADGSVAEVQHPDGHRPMLLQEGAATPDGVLHGAAQQWGKGFVISDAGSFDSTLLG